MKQAMLIGILIVLTVNAGLTQTSYTKLSLLSGKLEISLPSTYTALPKTEIDEEYPGNAPAVMYRDAARDISFKIVWENNGLTPDEVGRFKGWRVSNMLKDSTLTVTAHDLQDISDRKVGIIKANYPRLQRYHHYFFTSMDGKVLLMILECTSEQRTNNDAEFDKIMGSLQFR